MLLLLPKSQPLRWGVIWDRRSAAFFDFAEISVLTVICIKITTPFGVVIFMVEAGRVELPSENPSMETSPGADGYSGRRDRPVPLAPGKPSRLEVR